MFTDKHLLLRTGNFFQRHRWFVVCIWIAILILCFVYLPFAGSPFKIGGITDPRAESAKAQKIMTDKLSYGSGDVFVLYDSDKLRANDPSFVAQVQKSLNGLKKFPLQHQINSPYENSAQISDDKHAAYAVVIFEQMPDEIANKMQQFRDALGKPATLSVLVGGMAAYIADVKRISENDLIRAEMVAFPLSIIALLFVFGCVIAAILPIVSGLLSVTITITILFFLGHHFDFSIFVINIATMLGLGLSLDYTLLIVNRFREELAKHGNKEVAISITLATAGKTVLFSGLAVLISLCSLLFFPVNMLSTIGIGGVIVVIVSIINALVFLPALLALLGNQVNAWQIPYLVRKAVPTDNGLLFRSAMKIMKHPVIVFFVALIILLLLGYPFLHVKINRADATILPNSAESNLFLQKYKKQFNPTDLSPIYIVAETKDKSILTDANIASLYKFAQNLKKDDRVKSVNSIVTLDPHFTLAQYQHLYHMPAALKGAEKKFFNRTTKGRYTVLTVISKYAANDSKTYALVKTIRSTSLDNQIKLKVTGDSAVVLDTIHGVYGQFMLTIVVICIITYFVLLVLLRSVILPLKAILVNLLSLLVSYGMLVFIYQEGHFSKFLHFNPQGFTDLNLPILLFCALFGLSMDYEIFLLTRIKEYYDQTGDNSLSVALGLERSARIITSAALIFVLVSLAFVTANVIFIKAFGMATALAVLVDATIIRLLLVPSTMRLLGNWNWYLPAWLDKIIPHITHDQPIK
jgi:RND superfamily putative drug exporter